MAEIKTFADTSIFISSGWNVIPYDSIKYTEDGRKVALPAIKWNHFRYRPNKQVSPAGALICGGQLVIDCDSMDSADLILSKMGFTTADLTGSEIKDYIGLIVKTKRGYHFYFNGDKEISDCKGASLDIQATNNKLVYLPTKASEGKSVISVTLDRTEAGTTIRLYDLPSGLKEYLLELKDSKENILSHKEVRYTKGAPLAKIQKSTPAFYKRLTPSSFKAKPYYRAIIDKQGYLTPNDIQMGDGNDYLVGVAGILTADHTIDINAFWDFMTHINAEWESPISDAALVAKVKGFTENAYPDIPFTYDPDWERVKYSFLDIDGNEITLLYDLASSKYIIADSTGRTMVKNGTDITSFYANRFGETISANKLATLIPSAELIQDPLLPFGFTEDKRFNGFKHTPYVEIVKGDAVYSQVEIDNAKNSHIVKFINHLFKDTAPYFMAFLRAKLTTFEYTATSFCLFDKVGGAGKGALETLLGYFVGKDRVTRVPYETFSSKFTSDLEGKLFIFLNEYPDDYKQRAKVTDKLKDLTGSPILKVECKGKDPYEAKNLATYMVTSNRVSLDIKAGDRRFAVVNCNRKFDDEFGSTYFKTLASHHELELFAIYLKYHVRELTANEYRQPPTSDAKIAFIKASERPADTIAEAVGKKDMLFFKDISAYNAKNSTINIGVLAEYFKQDVKHLKNDLAMFDLPCTLEYDRTGKHGITAGWYMVFEKGFFSSTKSTISHTAAPLVFENGEYRPATDAEIANEAEAVF